MTMNTTMTATGEQTGGQLTQAPRNEAVERTLQDALRRMMDSVRPESIFGAVIERDGVAVIPCAEVSAGFGMGGGAGVGPAPANQPQSAATGETAGAQPTATAGGSGMGGGGGAMGRPVAMIVIAEGRARVTPVVDVTKVALAALTTLGFSAFLVSQMIGPRGRGGARLGAISAARFLRRLRASAMPVA
jgi:uncharacterized spore protein YtfJ